MAEYILGFNAETGAAIRNIDGLKKEIARVTKEFNSAEAGSNEFIQSASNLSQLNSGLRTARSAVVDLDRAYKDLSNSIASFRSGMGARGAIPSLASPIQGSIDIAGSPEYIKAQAREYEQAYQDLLRAADTRARAIAEFRSGMAERGAISGVASPIRGGADIIGSPDFLEPLSLGRLENRLTRLKEEARRINPDSDKWRAINKEAIELERGIAKIQKRQRLGPTMGQRAGAAGGAFLYGGGLSGGVGSALGGIGGGLLGGVPGAFAGAAIGQAVDNLGTALAGITSQASKVQQLQRGLALASIDAKDFAQAQAAVADTSAKLFIPIEQVTKSFAQLRVNTKQYGMSVEETKRILEGTILAVSAVGGSAEDVDGALRAVVQILSKGSVQAEELRGQLGERFPGAVVKFAQANKLSFEALQKGLEQGQIGIKEFVAFAEKNYEDYAEFSKKLATAPEFAGRRLQVALEQLSIEFGSLFGDVGANIQDGLAEGIRFIAEFIKENRVYLKQFIDDWGSIIGPIANVVGELLKVIIKFSVEVGKVFQNLFSLIRQSLGMANIGEARARLVKARAATAGKSKPEGNKRGGGAFIELSQAEQAYRDLGGDAAFNRANQPAVSDLTFGGPGAGISMDRTGGTGGGAGSARKEKELQDYIRNEQDFLRQLAQIGQNRIALTMGLSNEELSILQSQAQFRASNAINERQYLEDQRDAAKYSIETRDQYLKDIKEKYDNEKTLIQQQFDQSVYAPFLALEKQLIGENEALAASLDALKKGRLELTAEERIGLEVSKQLQAQENAGIQITPELIQSIKEKAKAQDDYNRSLSYGRTMLTLQNQLALAKILDPRAERRAQIRQENPDLSDAQIENQAALEEQVAAAAKARDQLRSIASSIGDSFGTAFKGIITGSATAQEALAGMFQSIADSFADMVAQMIAEWIKMMILKGIEAIINPLAGLGNLGGGALSGATSAASTGLSFDPGGMASFSAPWTFANGGIAAGGFTAFANGGMVTGPTMGLVGEGRYNEAIVPLPDGKSIPVELSGGGSAAPTVIVNVDAKGSQVEGNEQNANQLGRVISAAVQTELIKQQRPGGLLAR